MDRRSGEGRGQNSPAGGEGRKTTESPVERGGIPPGTQNGKNGAGSCVKYPKSPKQSQARRWGRHTQAAPGEARPQEAPFRGSGVSGEKKEGSASAQDGRVGKSI